MERSFAKPVGGAKTRIPDQEPRAARLTVKLIDELSKHNNMCFALAQKGMRNLP